MIVALGIGVGNIRGGLKSAALSSLHRQEEFGLV